MSSPMQQESWSIPAPVWKWIRWPLWVFAWVICFWAIDDRSHHARNEFNTDKWKKQHQRGDGNSGHTYIDFGGQWLSGRMVYEGYGSELYNRNRQREVARRGFSLWDEHATSQESILPPSKRKRGAGDADAKHDADALMNWLVGKDPEEWMGLGKAIAVPLMTGSHGNPIAAVLLQHTAAEQVTHPTLEKLHRPARGGALYPPIHGLFYAPLASMPPLQAYYAFQLICIAAAVVAGAAVVVMSRGRIWWPVATAVIMLYPGSRPGLDLGQNHLITTLILIVGWTLYVRGYEVGAGIVWGFLAYKPVWAIAFLLVPMLMGRMRFFLAMAATGLGLIAITLPIVGINAWFHWFEVGNNASGTYSTDQNWLRLSRDLAGLGRRLIVDVDNAPWPKSDLADILGWVLPLAVLSITAAVYLIRADRDKTTGITAGYILLAGYLGCFRFMYYDVTLSLVAIAAIFANPWSMLKSTTFTVVGTHDADTPSLARRSCAGYVNSFPLLILLAMLLLDYMLIGTKLHWLIEINSDSRTLIDATGGTSKYTPNITATTDYYYPTDTYLLLILWAWCGWRVWRDGERA